MIKYYVIGGVIIKKILWVSRHTMTNEQRDDLDRIYTKCEIIQFDETINDVTVLLEFNADVYAVVLPLDLVAHLKISTSADIIQPVSGRVKSEKLILNNATGKYENEYVYKHLYWQLIKKCEIETERL